MPKVTIDKNSSDKAVQNWISSCIRTCRREGLDAKQASGKCYGMAREATGKRLGRLIWHNIQIY